MDYSKTLNLPKTSFSMKANLTKLEPEIQRFWEEIDIYKLLRETHKGQPRFVLHDGPPYANGDIHMGHALNKILKDIIVKFKSMVGFDTQYVPGWDCHGLPIEYKVMSELDEKDSTRVQIRKRCREYALHYVQVQKEQFKRLGIFGDWGNPYLTLSNHYSAAIIEAFRKIVKKGFVYRSLKPVHWCRFCKTALAEAEVEYQELTSPSIYVRFPVKTCPSSLIPYSSSILVWTTTPWTLPANVAIAFHPEYDYIALEVNSEVLILLEELIDDISGRAGLQKTEVLSRFKGREFEGTVFSHPFLDHESKGVLAHYVAKDIGTGCVHIAPGHGLEDYETGLKYNLPVLTPVDDYGRFTEEAEEFKGQVVFEADEKIIELLKRKNTLFHQEEITHTYPHCWRCKNPIVFRATEQWFIGLGINDLAKRSLEATEKVEWIPAQGKERFYNTLSSRSDWCVSRQRTWGAPIPALVCTECGEYLLDLKVIERTRDLVKHRGTDVWFEEGVEMFLSPGLRCKRCGGQSFRKDENILDVWFDSGVSHQAVLREGEEEGFPADLYLEGSDQHRGWFQSSMLTSIAIEGQSPYRAVLTHGFMLDAEGRAMSKSLGNVISPMEIISGYGADIVRLWVVSTDYRSDVRLGPQILEQIAEAYRKIRNTCRYLLANLYDFDPLIDRAEDKDLLEIDRFILNELQLFIQASLIAYERFEFHRVYYLLVNFTSNTLSSLYLDILKDRLYTWGRDSKGRKAAQTVLYEIVTSLVRIMAPVLSFTAEEVWKYLRKEGDPQSVHLLIYPEVKSQYLLRDEEIKRWNLILEIRENVLSKIEEIRTKGVIGSSLEASLSIKAAGEEWRILKATEEELAAIFIVSEVRLSENSKFEVEVSPAKGEKCLRCWNYSEMVGKDELHPEICPRCLRVIAGE